MQPGDFPPLNTQDMGTVNAALSDINESLTQSGQQAMALILGSIQLQCQCGGSLTTVQASIQQAQSQVAQLPDSDFEGNKTEVASSISITRALGALENINLTIVGSSLSQTES